MPKGLLPLVAALAFFTLVVLAVLGWAFLGGQAGEQRDVFEEDRGHGRLSYGAGVRIASVG
ncbi:MAG TPA: hypothetical protein VNM91_07625 [Dehalococcoidia bacterium]|nr:hypothetical protein [Dehalococcoidia bacterium]